MYFIAKQQFPEIFSLDTGEGVCGIFYEIDFSETLSVPLVNSDLRELLIAK